MVELTARQRAELHGRLHEEYEIRVAEVRAELHQHGLGQHAELTGQVFDAGDASVADLLADLEIDLAQRHTERLRELERALTAVRDGRYGSCLDCGTMIPYQRLEALPTALRCAACQAQHERADPHHGTL